MKAGTYELEEQVLEKELVPLIRYCKVLGPIIRGVKRTMGLPKRLHFVSSS